MRKTLNRFLAVLGVSALALGARGELVNPGVKAVSPVAHAVRNTAQRVMDKSAGSVPNLLLWQMERNRRANTPAGFRSVVRQAPRGRYSAPATGAEVTLPPIYAHVNYWDGIDQDNDPTFLTRIPGVAGAEPERLTTALDGFTYGGVIKDNVYYSTGVYQFMGEIFVMNKGVDMDTYEVVYNHSSGSASSIPVATTYCPADGKIYGVFYNETLTGYVFGTIVYDENGGHTTPVCNITGSNWCALASTADGQLYAVTMERDDAGSTTVGSYLLKVDRATGAATTVGPTGQYPYYNSGATIDPDSGRMYWSVSPADNTGFLTEIDLATGHATKILDLWGNAQLTGLAVGKPVAAAKAPAAAGGMEFDFAGGALSGKVRFTAPATHFDGSPATGQLSYTLTVDGEQKASGTTSCGAVTEIPLTLPTDATYLFELTLENSAGKSPVCKAETYIGIDQPRGPANVRLMYEEGKMKVSWDAVTEGMSGGYVNPAEIVYMVTRKSPTFSIVEFGTEALEAEETVAEPAQMSRYVYQVAANYGGSLSPATASNTVVLGSIGPPFAENFGSADALELYTLADANGDGVGWSLSDGAATVGYNSRMKMDDWLITPAVKLEGGKSYDVSLKAWSASPRYFERIEVRYGTAAEPSAMTGTVIASTEIKGADDAAVTLTGAIRPDADVIYYIGVHGISDADKLGLYIDDLTISEGVADGAPDVVTGLRADGDPDGALTVTLSFNAPLKSLDGGSPGAIEKIEITRDGDLAGTITAPEAGAPQRFTDRLEATGTYHYAVTAYNAAGKGKTARIDAFCGLDLPGAPQNVDMAENPARPGEVTVSWDAVNVDHKGNPISPALVTYSIYAITDGYLRTPVVERIGDTDYTFQAVAPGDQDFVQYCVFAYTNEGEGDGTMTPMLAVGTPYAGMWESFADGDISYIFGTDGDASAFWDIYTDQEGVLSSQDGDNGFAAISGKYIGESADLITGKISLEGMERAALSLWRFTYAADDSNILEIHLSADGRNFNKVYGVANNELPLGWNRVVVPLDAYAGKELQVMLRGTLDAYAILAVDNLKVGPVYDYDLMAQSLALPQRVAAGGDFSIDVTVVNEGLNAMSASVVELYADGEPVESLGCPALPSGAMATVSFARVMHPLAEAAVEYHAVVSHVSDQNAGNDATATAAVSPMVSRLPEPVALHGELSPEKGAALSWSAPDVSAGVAEVMTESFESGEAFAHEFGGWTFVDADEHPVGGITDTEIPGITAGVTKASFYVFDSGADYPQFNSTYAARSGDRFLAAMFSYEDFTTNDWAISPRLTGEAQTVSFYARSYSGDYPEKIVMLYSAGGKELTEFVAVKSVAEVPERWTLYEFEVPAGARYFAIRSCATASFMLMLDDFTFIPDEPVVPELRGYNVYRNGDLVTSSPVAAAAYTDLTGPNAENAYRVTAVYDRGESKGSNEVRVATSAIGLSQADGVSVRAGNGMIVVTGADGMNVTVAAVDGKCIYSAIGSGRELAVPAAAGVYLVKAGATVTRVYVR